MLSACSKFWRIVRGFEIMETETLGHAPIVRRRTGTFPSRMMHYFDFTQWGGGLMRMGRGPGAVILNHSSGVVADIQTGRVYVDNRFKG